MRKSNKCRIRSMTHSDLQNVLNWRNNPEIRRYMFNQHQVSIEEHRNWFEQTSKDPSHRLLIVEEDGRPLGFIHFSEVSPGGTASWGFYKVPGAPKGSGEKMAARALEFAFEDLELHKVCGKAIDSNLASIRFHQALGFSEEGVARSDHPIEGEYRDLICFGLFHDDWTAKRS